MFDIEEEQIGNEINDTIYKATYKIYSKIVNQREKETIKLIQQYCKENNIYCDLIDEDMLKTILKLGVIKYNELQNNRKYSYGIRVDGDNNVKN